MQTDACESAANLSRGRGKDRARTEKLTRTEARQGREDGTGWRVMIGSTLAVAFAIIAIVVIGPETISAILAG